MAVVDLLFRQVPLPAHPPVDLLFGETESLPDILVTVNGALPGLGGSARVAHLQYGTLSGQLPALGGTIRLADQINAVNLTGALPGLSGSATVWTPRDVTLTGALPALGGSMWLGVVSRVSLSGALPGLSGSLHTRFNSGVDRPLVGSLVTSSQSAVTMPVGVEASAQRAQPVPFAAYGRAQSADHITTGVLARNPGALDAARSSTNAQHTEADRLPTGQLQATHAEMLHDRRRAVSTSHEEAVPVKHWIHTSSQDRYRDRRPAIRTSSQDGVFVTQSRRGRHQGAKPLYLWRKTRSQDAMVPPPGVITIIPPVSPCYTPDTDLLFKDLPSGTNLVFICENHPTPPDGETVIVPIRSVYIVINDVTLRRVSGSLMLPTLSLSMSIDVDSWTWGFNAKLPGSAFDDVRSLDGTPVELEASINGSLYRVLAESVKRDRSFGDSTVSISGRGKSAILAAPYAPILTFANDSERTAQQLMADVLTFNGIPLGWDIDWQLTDWLVPAGVFNVTGSYIEGLNAIVGAAGAYLQPDPADMTMQALLRYPVAPWEWGTVTPDFELPVDVTTTEGIELISKPAYNRVYVSGQQQGKLVRVTRAGTAGDISAQMVTDALITEAAAGRQRGLSILADTGLQAMVSLRLPVLDSTGIITPGKFVRYVDGVDEKIGIVRSTSVESTFPELWQSITVETHE